MGQLIGARRRKKKKKNPQNEGGKKKQENVQFAWNKVRERKGKEIVFMTVCNHTALVMWLISDN